ncbi:hypothetical protein BDEG_26946 [Batrachochytrium dendrobatidis JEL423]|uniref:Uncharacterized protein n=1 Tax=Batrachochytrium dendrobatidis (strain JEL423) TaxID=403673 RepID=A0A177WUN6_BATDL|nr:hypothetical protein BDEG_26946 [Batrachochytrium dendrobatidis JEL423]
MNSFKNKKNKAQKTTPPIIPPPTRARVKDVEGGLSADKELIKEVGAVNDKVDSSDIVGLNEDMGSASDRVDKRGNSTYSRACKVVNKVNSVAVKVFEGINPAGTCDGTIGDEANTDGRVDCPVYVYIEINHKHEIHIQRYKSISLELK